MTDEITQAVATYQAQWHELMATVTNTAYFAGLRPTAIGWKVADEKEYQRMYVQLRRLCDKTIETHMNERWISKMILRDEHAVGGIRIVKIMQRRPGSTDAVGLDHIDFLSTDKNVESILKTEPSLKWTRESNDAIADYEWYSVWFKAGEAKIKPYTVLDTVIKELQHSNT